VIALEGVVPTRFQVVSAMPGGTGMVVRVQVDPTLVKSRDGYTLSISPPGRGQNNNITHLVANSEEGKPS